MTEDLDHIPLTPDEDAAELAEIGARLRRAREAVAWSQKECARVARIRSSSWSRWETGRRPVDAREVARWCKMVGVPLDYIFTGRLHVRIERTLRERLKESRPDVRAAPLVEPPCPRVAQAPRKAPGPRRK